MVFQTHSGLPGPQGWHVIRKAPDGLMWERLSGRPLRVIESIATKSDGKRWLHVSISDQKGGLPTYDDIQKLRKLFIGEDRECYHIFPTKERYVNFKPVLHLFCCLDEPGGVLPHMEGQIGDSDLKRLNVNEKIKMNGRELQDTDLTI